MKSEYLITFSFIDLAKNENRKQTAFIGLQGASCRYFFGVLNDLHFHTLLILASNIACL